MKRSTMMRPKIQKSVELKDSKLCLYGSSSKQETTTAKKFQGVPSKKPDFCSTSTASLSYLFLEHTRKLGRNHSVDQDRKRQEQSVAAIRIQSYVRGHHERVKEVNSSSREMEETMQPKNLRSASSLSPMVHVPSWKIPHNKNNDSQTSLEALLLQDNLLSSEERFADCPSNPVTSSCGHASFSSYFVSRKDDPMARPRRSLSPTNGPLLETCCSSRWEETVGSSSPVHRSRICCATMDSPIPLPIRKPSKVRNENEMMLSAPRIPCRQSSKMNGGRDDDVNNIDNDADDDMSSITMSQHSRLTLSQHSRHSRLPVATVATTGKDLLIMPRRKASKQSCCPRSQRRRGGRRQETTEECVLNVGSLSGEEEWAEEWEDLKDHDGSSRKCPPPTQSFSPMAVMVDLSTLSSGPSSV